MSEIQLRALVPAIPRKHFGRDDSSTLVWQASAPEMNPTLPADYLKRMAEDDPEAYRSEVLGEFRQGISTFFDTEKLAACVVPERGEIPPVDGFRYAAFADPSGGSKDSFALAIGHRDRGIAGISARSCINEDGLPLREPR